MKKEHNYQTKKTLEAIDKIAFETGKSVEKIISPIGYTKANVSHARRGANLGDALIREFIKHYELNESDFFPEQSDDIFRLITFNGYVEFGQPYVIEINGQKIVRVIRKGQRNSYILRSNNPRFDDIEVLPQAIKITHKIAGIIGDQLI